MTSPELQHRQVHGDFSPQHFWDATHQRTHYRRQGTDDIKSPRTGKAAQTPDLVFRKVQYSPDLLPRRILCEEVHNDVTDLTYEARTRVSLAHSPSTTPRSQSRPSRSTSQALTAWTSSFDGTSPQRLERIERPRILVQSTVQAVDKSPKPQPVLLASKEKHAKGTAANSPDCRKERMDRVQPRAMVHFMQSPERRAGTVHLGQSPERCVQKPSPSHSATSPERLFMHMSSPDKQCRMPLHGGSFALPIERPAERHGPGKTRELAPHDVVFHKNITPSKKGRATEPVEAPQPCSDDESKPNLHEPRGRRNSQPAQPKLGHGCSIGIGASTRLFHSPQTRKSFGKATFSSRRAPPSLMSTASSTSSEHHIAHPLVSKRMPLQVTYSSAIDLGQLRLTSALSAQSLAATAMCASQGSTCPTTPLTRKLERKGASPTRFPRTGKPITLKFVCTHKDLRQPVIVSEFNGCPVTANWESEHLMQVSESVTGVRRDCQKLYHAGREMPPGKTVRSIIGVEEAHLPERFTIHVLVQEDVFPLVLGPWHLVEVPLSGGDFALPQSLEGGFHWTMKHEVIEHHGVRGTEGVHITAFCSPPHPMVFDLEERQAVGLPLEAEEFAWSYPVANWQQVERDPHLLHDWAVGAKDCSAVKDFLVIGGFIFFDRQRRVIRTTTPFMSKGQKGGLQFGRPQKWEAGWTRILLGEGRFQRVSIGPLRDAGVHFFAWLRPDEVLEDEDGLPLARQPQIPRGGFAYLFHEMMASSNEDVAGDCYFAITTFGDQAPDKSEALITVAHPKDV
eukprot:CAMPEP_0172720294 /NCGR_PEP_ID=MMETSP1074-20121228/76562_1 /TAXON_ID=2916 /ORGANISM="Ceratium fusus, Strain PA161109" /LENGTH=790 /DNA_ID=CAMNT_0013545787 /DNA_START=55 /DNA_END=2427 /DNA_ORIENTATION=-